MPVPVALVTEVLIMRERAEELAYARRYNGNVIATVELAQCAFDKTTLKPARSAVYAVRCGLPRPTSRVIHYHESYKICLATHYPTG